MRIPSPFGIKKRSLEQTVSLPPLVEPAAELTVDEVRRYSRHLIIPDVGMTGQKRLKNAKVLVVGAGGLGSPALLYLAVHDVRLDNDNVMEIFSQYDLIVDGTDNFATRYMVNDACVLLGKPYVWGSIYRFDGQASVFWAEYGPCYRCLYPEPPPPGMVPSCA